MGESIYIDLTCCTSVAMFMKIGGLFAAIRNYLRIRKIGTRGSAFCQPQLFTVS